MEKIGISTAEIMVSKIIARNATRSDDNEMSLDIKAFDKTVSDIINCFKVNFIK